MSQVLPAVGNVIAQCSAWFLQVLNVSKDNRHFSQQFEELHEITEKGKNELPRLYNGIANTGKEISYSFHVSPLSVQDETEHCQYNAPHKQSQERFIQEDSGQNRHIVRIGFEIGNFIDFGINILNIDSRCSFHTF